MVDVFLLCAFIGLPIAAWFLSRSLVFVAVASALGVGIAGNVVQTSAALGLAWNVRSLQGLVVAVLVLVLAIGWLVRRQAQGAPTTLRRQVLVVVAPALVVGS